MNQKLLKIVIAIMAILLSGSVGFNISGVNLGNEKLIQTGFAEVISPIVRDVVKEELATFSKGINERFDDLEMQTYNSDIEELCLALKDIRTSEEVDNIVVFWIDNGWTKKLSAINRISGFDKAREKLRLKLYSDDVFRTLMLYSS